MKILVLTGFNEGFDDCKKNKKPPRVYPDGFVI
jgi:hypothetical protein